MSPNVLNSRAYASYISTRNDIVAGTGEKALHEFADRYKVYLKGWMPQEKSARILDAACGHGNALYAFHSWGYSNLEGVDLSEEQVYEARKRFPQVVCGDVITFLSSHSEQYELITAFDLLEHLPPDEASAFLDGAYQALREGGRLVLQTPNAAGARPGNLMWGDITHCHFYAPCALRQLLNLTGFTDINFRETCPLAHGIKSFCRVWLWKCLRIIMSTCDIIETGKRQTVYTRNMLVSARKYADGNLLTGAQGGTRKK